MEKLVRMLRVGWYNAIGRYVSFKKWDDWRNGK